MRKALAFFLALAILIAPSYVFAGSTILAAETMRINASDDPETAIRILIARLVESAKKHSCSVSAEKSGKTLMVGIKSTLVEGEDSEGAYVNMFMEMVTEDCG